MLYFNAHITAIASIQCMRLMRMMNKYDVCFNLIPFSVYWFPYLFHLMQVLLQVFRCDHSSYIMHGVMMMMQVILQVMVQVMVQILLRLYCKVKLNENSNDKLTWTKEFEEKAHTTVETTSSYNIDLTPSRG